MLAENIGKKTVGRKIERQSMRVIELFSYPSFSYRLSFERVHFNSFLNIVDLNSWT